MQDKTSDTQIRAGLRAVLTRHRVDLNKTSFFCARGIVRMLGQLNHLGAYADRPVELGEVEVIEHELQGVPGVVRVHFDLSNVRKLSNGKWEEVKKRGGVRERVAVSEGSLEDW